MPGRAHLLRLLGEGEEEGGEGEVFASAQWPRALGAGHGAAWGRQSFLATSWLVPEEEKLEPGWPVALMKHYRKMIDKEETDRLEAAMWKVAAERRANRAQEAGKVVDAEARANRDADKALEGLYQPTLRDQINTEKERLKLAVAKEGIVLREADETKQLLAADELRDAERAEQLQSLKREADYIQGLKDAEHENELRMTYRNRTPGEPAINGHGKVITSKEGCEAERNTVFRNGMCIVGGVEEGPDSAEEIGASARAADSEEALEKAREALKAKDAATARAGAAKEEAQQELQVLRKKLSHAKAPSERQKKAVEDAEADLAKLEKERKSAQGQLDVAKATKEAARKAHQQDLKNLLKVQDGEEHADEHAVEGAAKAERASMDKIERDEDELAKVEEGEAKLVGRHAQELGDEASAHEGFERDHLGAEAGIYKLWARDSAAEAKALHDRDNKEVVRLHGLQREDSLLTGERHREVLNDAATNGGGPEVLKPTSLSKEEEEELEHDNGQLGDLLQDEKKAEEKVYDSRSERSDFQEHRNMVGLRRAKTLDSLRHSEMQLSALLCVCDARLPPRRHSRTCRRETFANSRKAPAAWGRFL